MFSYGLKMCSLLRISKEELPYLRGLYEVERPLHIITVVAISHFIEHFENKPEWDEKIDFWTSSECWKQTGTFAMANKNDQHILFNTLEPWPYQSLHRTLELLNYDHKVVFICFRDIFRPVVLDVIRVRNLQITFDSGTRSLSKPPAVKNSYKIE